MLYSTPLLLRIIYLFVHLFCDFVSICFFLLRLSEIYNEYKSLYECAAVRIHTRICADKIVCFFTLFV